MKPDDPDTSPRRWFVYMLECENGSYYTGLTDDPERRYAEHKNGTAGAKYTRSFRPVRIACCWRLTGTRGTANRVERLIKGLARKRKDEIVARPMLLGEMVRGRYGDDFGIMLHDIGSEPSASGSEFEITGYVPSEREWTVRNPFLEEVLAFIAPDSGRSGGDPGMILNERRSDFINRYAFSIPTIVVIEEIAARSPLVEIGAGNGYWAMCLRDAGADIIAYDTRPPGEEPPWEWRGSNQWFEDAWSMVHEGDETMAGRYPERTLFLCWPPVFDPMAVSALRQYRAAGGRTLVFIGSRGSCADEEFFHELESLKPIVSRRIPSWPGVEEWLMIYEFPPVPRRGHELGG